MRRRRTGKNPEKGVQEVQWILGKRIEGGSI